ncbi:MAG: MBL fold metallo-hydrolase [Actinobacteria bacterium]|nr:MBL fold metallo-hydrolase [Actinomycetota bacterium]
MDGAWFVDTRCIDCDACRQLAPDLIARVDRTSVVTRQPTTPEEEDRMWLGALACPTRSIGTAPPRPEPRGIYPHHLEDGVHYCGFNSPDSFGANAFFVVRPEGNVLIDAPRWTRKLAEPFEEAGGIAHVLLTHRDDVADADRYAETFGARVWIHEHDASAAPFATDLLRGADPTEIRPDLVAIPVPGHTRGSVMFLLEDTHLFTGDSLYWGRSSQTLQYHRSATWYSHEVQADSLERLADEHRFEYVLAGHGDRARRPADEMHDRLADLVRRMRGA